MDSIAGLVPESWNKPWPFGLFLFGLVLFLLAVIGTFTGKTYGRGMSADRAKDPVNYWESLVLQYSIGAFFIWYWAFVMSH
jgi:hypothetical protein